MVEECVNMIDLAQFTSLDKVVLFFLKKRIPVILGRIEGFL
jgi:hypothetical protein